MSLETTQGTVVIVFHIGLVNSQSVFSDHLPGIILKCFNLCQLTWTRFHICITNALF